MRPASATITATPTSARRCRRTRSRSDIPLPPESVCVTSSRRRYRFRGTGAYGSGGAERHHGARTHGRHYRRTTPCVCVPRSLPFLERLTRDMSRVTGLCDTQDLLHHEGGLSTEN